MFREIVQYSAAADSTIPSNKRKIEDTGIKEEYSETATLKEIKSEPEGNFYFVKFLFISKNLYFNNRPTTSKKEKEKEQGSNKWWG